MESEPKPVEPASRPLTLLALAVSALVTIGAVAFFFAMPRLIAQGGIPAAQTDFLTLSPIFFPRLTFALLAFLGLTYFIGNVRLLPVAIGGRIFKEAGIIPRVLALYAIAVLYPILLPWLGFIIPTILLMGGMVVFLGIRVWWHAATFALVTPVTIRFVFERLLAISLPRAEYEWLGDAEEALMRILDSIFF
jgi:hypothetical protein